MFKLELEKGKETEIILPTESSKSSESSKKQENFRKTSTSALFFYFAKAFDCVDHIKLENSSRDVNTRPPYPSPEKSVSRSRSNS